MALSATVTKKSVLYIQPKLHEITFNLLLKNGVVEVLNHDVSIQFHAGDTPASKVTRVVELMQEKIDNYKSEQAIFTSALLNNAVTSINERLVI